MGGAKRGDQEKNKIEEIKNKKQFEQLFKGMKTPEGKRATFGDSWEAHVVAKPNLKK